MKIVIIAQGYMSHIRLRRSLRQQARELSQLPLRQPYLLYGSDFIVFTQYVAVSCAC